MKKALLCITTIIPAITFGQNVGIGTLAPENKLHIVSADSNAVKIEKTTTLDVGSTNAIYFKNGSYFTGAIKQIGASTAASRTGIYGYAVTQAKDLREHITILDGGNVGIGNTNPGQKLVVAGDATISSHLSSNTLQSATSLQVGTTIYSSGNITSNANVIAAGGLFAGNTNSTTNGGIRYNTTDSKMEYREGDNWKRISKPFYQSNTIAMTSAVRNTLLVHPTFEWVVPETGFYQVHLQTDVYPVFKTNGCQLQYLDNAAGIWIYSKTRSLQFFSAGNFKWYIVNGQTGCQGAQSIPLTPSNNRIIYLQKDEIMTLAFQFDMYNVIPGVLENWTGQASVNFVKTD